MAKTTCAKCGDPLTEAEQKTNADGDGMALCADCRSASTAKAGPTKGGGFRAPFGSD